MRIYTSNFASVKALNEAGIMPIGIARFEPKWFKGQSYKRLAPFTKMLQLDEATYREQFTKILNGISVESVIKDLGILSEGKDVALLCYEKEGDFCHRQMVADWLRNAGVEVEEFKTVVEAPPSLFE